MGISKQVKYLREFDCFGTVKQAMLEAADTIESLSAKMADMNGQRRIAAVGGYTAVMGRIYLKSRLRAL